MSILTTLVMLQSGFTIGWLLRGYLEAKRCPKHSSLFIDPPAPPPHP